jgi:hypothetical protein
MLHYFTPAGIGQSLSILTKLAAMTDNIPWTIYRYIPEATELPYQ